MLLVNSFIFFIIVVVVLFMLALVYSATILSSRVSRLEEQQAFYFQGISLSKQEGKVVGDVLSKGTSDDDAVSPKVEPLADSVAE